jgi:RNA-directed DNA polymerase
VTTAKPFTIPKRLVYEAFKAVKANAGSTGVDKETIEDFETNLKDNLYRIWNRMSSGSYVPPPVKAVAIPKKTGGERIPGVPTVADRVAQMVVKQMLEPELEPIFLPDSYGYRPGKSALDAVAVTRERCWRHDWVLEFDIPRRDIGYSVYFTTRNCFGSMTRKLSVTAFRNRRHLLGTSWRRKPSVASAKSL